MSQQQITRETVVPQPELTIEEAKRRIAELLPDHSFNLVRCDWVWPFAGAVTEETSYRFYSTGINGHLETVTLEGLIEKIRATVESQVLELV